MEVTGYIYSLNCPITGAPKYIGKTIKSLNNRLFGHLNEYRCTKKGNWIKSLRRKSLIPIIEMVDEVDRLKIDFWEKHYISLYKSWGFDLKNMTTGGEGWSGGKHTSESKLKMSASLKGKVSPRKGVILSDSIKKKISDSKIGTIAWNKGKNGIGLGRIVSSETRIKIGNGNRGKKVSIDTINKIKGTFFKKGEPSWNTGKKMSEEMRRNMSLSRKGMPSGRKGLKYNKLKRIYE